MCAMASLPWEGQGPARCQEGFPAKPGCVLAALQHREEGRGQSCSAGFCLKGHQPVVSRCWWRKEGLAPSALLSTAHTSD